ncbi:TRAP transporter substrate-binding protein [Denitrobaculum tricleocarpae]|uniref:TRAP transporter substrate-binding protein n=1 Tax=Denitrobaculum tricleocarpae TaxID=2591009 RepID=A0A545TWL7_9PROT|nr:TRAP transporter substrate-binding protein [Denitrobaculum tricleocarpae]TQV81615.1 TRAP transporter substrate-binding protein [Denitrobaculum tricleocarpae]
MMKLFKLLATTTLAVVLSSSAYADKLQLKFGHVGAPGSLFAESAEEFARVANEKLGDKAEVVVFGASQLGKDNELLQKLKLGQIHFSLPSSVMSSVSDEFGVFEMPYIIKDRGHMKRVEGAIMDSVLQPAANAKGYRILALWENGFRHITNNTRPINVPADLAGVKLRTPKGAWRVKMFQLYGANPTPMAFSEVFTALQTGVIDGQENPYAQIWSAKFQEVQKYLSVTGHVYTPAYVLTSEKHFARLPQDVQDALSAAAQETQSYVYATAAMLETDLLTKLKDGGVAVNEADKAAFVEASKPIYDEFSTSVDGGAALVKTVLDLAN